MGPWDTLLQIALTAVGIIAANIVINALAGLGTNFILGLDSMFENIVDFARKPWFMADPANPATGVYGTFVNFAYALAVLYFLIELIGQIIALDKVTPETVVRMLIKLFIAKTTNTKFCKTHAWIAGHVRQSARWTRSST